MVVAFHNNQVARRLYQNVIGLIQFSFGIAASAEGEKRVSFCIKFLYPVIPAVGHVDIPFRVYRDAFGILKLTRIFSLAPKAMQKVELGVVDLNAVIEIIGKQKVPFVCKAQT